MATLGGVLGPAGLFLLLNHFFGHPDWSNGWGICTATDIALAWLFAKLVFGKDHPAVSFLLLLAVADDAIGLAIIAIFYPTPGQPIRPIFLLLVLAGMLVAFLFRKLKVKTYWPYILVAGILCWLGLFKTGVSPALSLVFVVPFLPNNKKEFEALEKFGKETTLTKFEHNVSPIVDYGLFFFGFAMAGVRFSVMSALTFIVMISLIVGKMLGISLFTFIFGHGFKFGLPKGMSNLDVIVAGIVGHLRVPDPYHLPSDLCQGRRGSCFGRGSIRKTARRCGQQRGLSPSFQKTPPGTVRFRAISYLQKRGSYCKLIELKTCERNEPETGGTYV